MNLLFCQIVCGVAVFIAAIVVYLLWTSDEFTGDVYHRSICLLLLFLLVTPVNAQLDDDKPDSKLENMVYYTVSEKGLQYTYDGHVMNIGLSGLPIATVQKTITDTEYTYKLLDKDTNIDIKYSFNTDGKLLIAGSTKESFDLTFTITANYPLIWLGNMVITDNPDKFIIDEGLFFDWSDLVESGYTVGVNEKTGTVTVYDVPPVFTLDPWFGRNKGIGPGASITNVIRGESGHSPASNGTAMNMTATIVSYSTGNAKMMIYYINGTLLAETNTFVLSGTGVYVNETAAFSTPLPQVYTTETYILVAWTGVASTTLKYGYKFGATGAYQNLAYGASPNPSNFTTEADRGAQVWVDYITGSPPDNLPTFTNGSGVTGFDALWDVIADNKISGETANFTAQMNDDLGLSHYIFSYNNGTGWVNTTAVAMGGGTQYNMSVLRALPIHNWVWFAARVYCNDTTDQWVQSDTLNLTTVPRGYVGFEDYLDFQYGAGSAPPNERHVLYYDYLTYQHDPWWHEEGSWYLTYYNQTFADFEPTTTIVRDGLQAGNVTLQDPGAGNPKYRLEILHLIDPTNDTEIRYEAQVYLPNSSLPVPGSGITIFRPLYMRCWDPNLNELNINLSFFNDTRGAHVKEYMWLLRHSIDLQAKHGGTSFVYNAYSNGGTEGGVPAKYEAENNVQAYGNRWTNLTAIIHRNNYNNSDGRIRIWINGTLIWDIEHVQTVALNNTYMDSITTMNPGGGAYYKVLCTGFSNYAVSESKQVSVLFDDMWYNTSNPEVTYSYDLTVTETDGVTEIPIASVTIHNGTVVYNGDTNVTGQIPTQTLQAGTYSVTVTKTGYSNNVTALVLLTDTNEIIWLNATSTTPTTTGGGGGSALLPLLVAVMMFGMGMVGGGRRRR